MMQWKHVGRVGLCCAIAALTVGCGSGTGSKAVKVTGSVTQNGKPLPGANVGFKPLDSGQDANQKGAITNIEGRFEVRLAPGNYTVLLSRMVDKNGNIIDPSKEDFGQLEASHTTRQSLPAAYSNPTLSPFKAEVLTKDTDLQPFDVKDIKK